LHERTAAGFTPAFLGFDCQIVIGLQLQPELCSGVKYCSQSERRRGSYPALSAHNFADSHPLKAALDCQLVLGESKRLKKFCAQYLAGRIGLWADWSQCMHICLMIIGYFNFKSLSVTKLKADAPLVFDPNTVLALAAHFEFFKTTAGQISQNFDTVGGI
jgi:hypothetical protein